MTGRSSAPAFGPSTQHSASACCAQDCLTTLIELSPEGISAEVIGSMIGYVEIAEGNGPLIARMTDPAIRIVALTVTEGGYYIDPVTKGFDANHPDIIHDAANPDTPRTAFGAMVAGTSPAPRRGHWAVHWAKL